MSSPRLFKDKKIGDINDGNNDRSTQGRRLS